MELQELKWTDVAALSKDTPIVFPIAALEQHGRHTPQRGNKHHRSGAVPTDPNDEVRPPVGHDPPGVHEPERPA